MVDWVIRGMICLALVLISLGEFMSAQKWLFDAGVIVLIATPIVRIIAAALQFIRQRDFLYLAFSLFILTVIGAGLYL